MTIKISKTASEYNNSTLSEVYVQDLAHNLLDYKILGLTKGLIIPDDLIAELELFAQRNSLKEIIEDENQRELIDGCCPRCLKAHMLKTAERLGISLEGRQFLSMFMRGEVGHQGYYLDGEELIEI